MNRQAAMACGAMRTEGARARQKRERLLRIAVTGLQLFVRNGYEGTTLDEIAAEAGIARRTFFHYFKSKESILMTFLDGGFGQGIRPLLLAQPTDQSPFRAVRCSIVRLMSQRDPAEMLAVSSLLGSTEALRARIPAAYAQMERAVYEALCEMWPDDTERTVLRMVAMVAVGAMRIAKERWYEDGGKRPLSGYLEESFDAVERVF